MPYLLPITYNDTPVQHVLSLYYKVVVTSILMPQSVIGQESLLSSLIKLLPSVYLHYSRYFFTLQCHFTIQMDPVTY